MFQRIWSRVYSFFFTQKFVFFSLAMSSLLLNAGTYLLIYLNTKMYQGTQQQFVLHYTVALGIDYIDYWYYIYLFPQVGSGIAGVHLLLAGWLWKTHRLLAYFLLVSMILMEGILGIVSWFLLNIN